MEDEYIEYGIAIGLTSNPQVLLNLGSSKGARRVFGCSYIFYSRSIEYMR